MLPLYPLQPILDDVLLAVVDDTEQSPTPLSFVLSLESRKITELSSKSPCSAGDYRRWFRRSRYLRHG